MSSRVESRDTRRKKVGHVLLTVSTSNDGREWAKTVYVPGTGEGDERFSTLGGPVTHEVWPVVFGKDGKIAMERPSTMTQDGAFLGSRLTYSGVSDLIEKMSFPDNHSDDHDCLEITRDDHDGNGPLPVTTPISMNSIVEWITDDAGDLIRPYAPEKWPKWPFWPGDWRVRIRSACSNQGPENGTDLSNVLTESQSSDLHIKIEYTLENHRKNPGVIPDWVDSAFFSREGWYNQSPSFRSSESSSKASNRGDRLCKNVRARRSSSDGNSDYLPS